MLNGHAEDEDCGPQQAFHTDLDALCSEHVCKSVNELVIHGIVECQAALTVRGCSCSARKSARNVGEQSDGRAPLIDPLQHPPEGPGCRVEPLRRAGLPTDGLAIGAEECGAGVCAPSAPLAERPRLIENVPRCIEVQVEQVKRSIEGCCLAARMEPSANIQASCKSPYQRRSNRQLWCPLQQQHANASLPCRAPPPPLAEVQHRPGKRCRLFPMKSSGHFRARSRCCTTQLVPDTWSTGSRQKEHVDWAAPGRG